jgi:hypothetical protein
MIWMLFLSSHSSSASTTRIYGGWRNPPSNFDSGSWIS